MSVKEGKNLKSFKSNISSVDSITDNDFGFPKVDKKTSKRFVQNCLDFENTSVRKEDHQYHDLTFTLVFIITLIGYLAAFYFNVDFGGLSFMLNDPTKIPNEHDQYPLSQSPLFMLFSSVILSTFISFSLLLAASKNSKIFIKGGFIANIIICIITSAFLFANHNPASGSLLAFSGLFSIYCYRSYGKRFDFSASIFNIVMGVCNANKVVFIISFIGSFIAMLFLASFTILIFQTYYEWEQKVNFEGGDNYDPKMILLLIFITYSGFYITEVIRSTIHVSISGLFGSWYYSDKLSGNKIPLRDALFSIRKACTFKFGSICFGSLIITILELLHQAVSFCERETSERGGLWHVVSSVLSLLLSILDRIIRYFNHYIYSYVALYGKSFIESAKSTIKIFKSRGFAILINDCIIDTSLKMYCLSSGIITALLSFIYLKFFQPTYNAEGSYDISIPLFGFILSAEICFMLVTTIKSCTSTFFIALSRDPDVFEAKNPIFFHELVENYPQILERVFEPEDLV